MNIDNIKSEHIRQLLNREFEAGNKLWFANNDSTVLHLSKEFITDPESQFLKMERKVDRNINFLRYSDPKTGESVEYNWSW
ncbi:hypothetical protein [Thalassolituus oleivorans]|uniref:hypothetical protein n=1 Tax=Thalassolituus oleivorans TaxID=187493 RepID=UPI0023EFC718|nr:hypothetical protein [Thalassolituus oleivorans]